MRIEIIAEALEELEASAQFYEARQAGLGERFLSEFQKVRELIRNLPAVGHPAGPKGVLQFSLSKFPHRVLYYIAGDVVRILAVSHHSRRPEHWKDRLGDSV